MPDPTLTSSTITNPILNRFFLSPADRKDKEKGKQIIKAIYDAQAGSASNSSLNFFSGRAARWKELLLWAKGAQPMNEFLDYLNVSDANKSYVKIDATQQRLAAQFIGTLVESMAKTKVYPCVDAIDDGSLNEKEQRKLDALFRMHEIETIKAVQEQFQVEVEPPNAYVPDDEQSAEVYFELEDRLPKEIRFEKYLAKVQNDIQFEKVINRKGLYDMVVLNFEGTKIEKLTPYQYTVRKCVPSNMVYNFFLNDTGGHEVTMIGEFYNLKVIDYRSKFGKSPNNPDGLSEKEIFELAKLSSEKNGVGAFKHIWNDNWANYNMSAPYDDSSILVLDVEVNCGEDVYYVSRPDNFGKENIEAKKNVPYQQVTKKGEIIEQPKPEGVEIIKKQRNPWMRGVYAPFGDKMLYWGAPDIIITPYTDTFNPLSSFTINIPNNDGEYVPSLFERILEPLKEYSLVKLKRKQLIAKLKPKGIRIDVESARNLDLGGGDSIAWEEVVRIYDQTGNELWSSKGANPLDKEAPPLGNTVDSNSINDIVGLTNTLLGIVAEIRSLIGVPTYRDGSDVGDRTAARLAEGQNQSSYNVTDYVLNGHTQLWEETFYKICLLHWNDIVKSEPESKADMINSRFDVKVKIKSTEYQRQLLEQDIQRYSQVVDKDGNPALTPKDAMMLREIENYKSAVLYLEATMKRNERMAMEKSARLQQQNAKEQAAVAQQSAAAADKMQQDKLAHEQQLKEVELKGKKELEMIAGLFGIYGKGLPMPAELKPLAEQAITNIMIPIVMENKQMQGAVQAQVHDAMAHQYAQQQQMQQGQQPPQEAQEQQQEPPSQEQPQEQMEPQPQ